MSIDTIHVLIAVGLAAIVPALWVGLRGLHSANRPSSLAPVHEQYRRRIVPRRVPYKSAISLRRPSARD